MWGIVWTDIASVGFVVVLAFAQRQMSRPGHRRASCSAEDNSDLSGMEETRRLSRHSHASHHISPTYPSSVYITATSVLTQRRPPRWSYEYASTTISEAGRRSAIPQREGQTYPGFITQWGGFKLLMIHPGNATSPHSFNALFPSIQTTKELSLKLVPARADDLGSQHARLALLC